MAKRRIKPGDLPAAFTVFFDGCCEPVNPGGTAGYGYVIFEGPVSAGERIDEHSGMVEASPTTSNNVAEYLAVRQALEWLDAHGHRDKSIHFFGDSLLVICQLWGDPRTRERKKWNIHGIDVKKDRPPGRYAEHAVAARALLGTFTRCNGLWIPREENSIADELSKAQLKRAGVEFRIQPEEPGEDVLDVA